MQYVEDVSGDRVDALVVRVIVLTVDRIGGDEHIGPIGASGHGLSWDRVDVYGASGRGRKGYGLGESEASGDTGLSADA